MEDARLYYIGCLGGVLVVLGLFRLVTGTKNAEPKATVLSSAFQSFQRNYVTVYCIMMAADWMQGPYVYALYDHYGYSMSEIGILFVAGFASSAVFGTIAGTMADKYGRKKLCLAFSVIYSLACITKHFSAYWTLMIGRVLGGISTSILFSAFEAWMVNEHHEAPYPDEWLGLTYSICTSGNALVAILSGILAEFVRGHWGPVAPFDTSLIFLIIGGAIVWTSWRENYGDSKINLDVTLSNAWSRIIQDRKIVLLGLIQSLFEGSMYIFVFMWTPALESTSNQKIYHGWIFSSFMICVFLGSTLFKYFLDKKLRVEKTAVYIFAASAIALSLPILIMNHTLRLISFFVFEVCVGMFWPSLGFLRSRYVPEDVRATVMTFFRIPLNIIVVTVLASISYLSEKVIFMCCVGCLIPALIFQLQFAQLTVDSPDQAKKSSEIEQTEKAIDGDEVVELIPNQKDHELHSSHESNSLTENSTPISPSTQSQRRTQNL